MLVELLLDQIKVNDLICFMREKPLALKARGFFGILKKLFTKNIFCGLDRCFSSKNDSFSN